ncbi:MAG TPA: VTC domain-containing protein, partial [Clostridia bacterium]|nr:VTC domain-containing protein [Clostridia bacterium]
METALPNLRYERKFVAEGFTAAEALARVRRHPWAFREVYPPRIVNNIYLDSPSRRNYHDHVNGTANRTKTRVRWYGPQFENAPRPTLERKLKRGMVSGKTGHALPHLAINGGCLR